MNNGYISIGILLTAGTLYKISSHETNLISGEHTEIFLRRLFHKVLPLDIKLASKRHLAASKLRILQVVRNVQFFHLAFWIVADHQLYGI